jgi:hypothetical protein
MATDSEQLLRFAAREPNNVVLRCMLTDALMEERDLNRLEADQLVERSIQAEWDTLCLARAARFIARNSPLSRAIRACCSAVIDSPDDRICLLTVPGEMGPHLISRALGRAADGVLTVTAQVGAEWIVAKANEASKRSRKLRRYYLSVMAE